MTTTQPGWYPDPQNPPDDALVRRHAVDRARLAGRDDGPERAQGGSSRSAGKTALIVVAIVVVTLLVLGILAAIALPPVWLSQSQKEEFARACAP